MNIVAVKGGVGNQFFQYAFGRVLQEMGKQVAYDLSWYENSGATNPNYPRPLRLGMFQLSPFMVAPPYDGNPTVIEKRIGYEPKVFALKVESNFDGYWQYYSYYQNILPALKREFQLRTEYYTEEFMKVADKILDTTSISLHVRRGDYELRKNGSYWGLPLDYYFNAVSMIGTGDLFIFSDDIPWCKSMFKPSYFSRKITFVKMEDYLSLELMRLCKHNIIANSTFSWWAAYLNDNLSKIVIRPKQYLGDSEDDSDKLRYPKEWIKVREHVIHNI